MDTQKIIELEEKLLMRTYSRPKIVIDKGKGCYVFDKEGKRYIDLVGGLATCLIGHGNRQFSEAIKKQAGKLATSTNLYYSEEQVKLAEKLAGLSGLSRCFFSNSGTEAVEAAIKLTRKHTKKTGIITAKHGFHGRTFGSLAATDKEKIKKPFNPMLEGFKHVEFGNASAAEKAITKNTAAIMVEPIQGEAGVIVPRQDYLKHLREICEKHGLLLVLDEIQTGCGRTGKFFAYQHSKITPDIVTLAKGLGNGFPIGATIANEDVGMSFEKGDHGTTFGGNSLACKAANFTIEHVLSNNLIKNAEIQGKYFLKKLASARSGSIKEVRGRGLMIGMEMKEKPDKIVKKCMERGLLVNLTAEKVLRFLPPLIITNGIIDNSIEILKSAIENEN